MSNNNINVSNRLLLKTYIDIYNKLTNMYNNLVKLVKLSGLNNSKFHEIESINVDKFSGKNSEISSKISEIASKISDLSSKISENPQILDEKIKKILDEKIKSLNIEIFIDKKEHKSYSNLRTNHKSFNPKVSGSLSQTAPGHTEARKIGGGKKNKLVRGKKDEKKKLETGKNKTKQNKKK